MTRRLLDHAVSSALPLTATDLLTGTLHARGEVLATLDTELHARPLRPEELLRVSSLFRSTADDHLLAMVAEMRTRADALSRISAALNAPVDQADALTLFVAKLAAEALSGVAVVRLASDDGSAPTIAHHLDANLEAATATVTALAAEPVEAPWTLESSGQAVLAGRDGVAGGDSSWATWSTWQALGCRTAMAVPILAMGEHLGVLVVYRDTDGRDYTRADLAFAHEMAGRLGLALHNAELGRRIAAEIRAREHADGYLFYALETQRRLAAGLDSARVDERRRIVESLHDDPIQAMTFALTQVGRAGLLDPATNAQASNTATSNTVTSDTERSALLHDAEVSISTAIERLRAMAFELAPRDLDGAGLEVALRHLVAQLFDGTDTTVTIDSDPDAAVPPNERATAVAYRVLREALINVHKHAGATTVLVVLRRLGNGLHASVHDNGSCDTRSARTTDGGHMGLSIIANIATSAGGYARFAPGESGSTVEMWLPVQFDDLRIGA